MKKHLTFRPHHFLCTVGFQGMGYSPVFVENFQGIVDLLQQDESTPIHVVTTNDSICSKCPHQASKTTCSEDEKITQLDRAHANILKIKAGDVLSWREAKHTLKARMSLELFHQACAPCEWKKLGVCEQALLLLD